MGGLPDPRLAAFPPAPEAHGIASPPTTRSAVPLPGETPLPPGVLAGQAYPNGGVPAPRTAPWMQQGMPTGPTQPIPEPQRPPEPAYPPTPAPYPAAASPLENQIPTATASPLAPNLAGAQWPPNGTANGNGQAGAHPVLASLLKTPSPHFNPGQTRDPLADPDRPVTDPLGGPIPAANSKAPATTAPARPLRSQYPKRRDSKARIIIPCLLFLLAGLAVGGWAFRDTIRTYVRTYRYRHSHQDSPETSSAVKPHPTVTAPVAPSGDGSAPGAENHSKFNPANKPPSSAPAATPPPGTSGSETIQRANTASQPPSASLQEIESKNLPPQVTVHASEEAAPAVDVLQKFFHAPTWRERVAFVQLGDQLKSLMEKYYTQTKDGPIEIENIDLLPHAPNDDSTQAQYVFVVMGPSLKQPLPVMVQNTPTGFKVDWLTFTEFKDDLLRKFAENYQDGSARFHVAIHRCHYLESDVPELDKKICFEAAPPMPGYVVHAFVDKKSALAKELDRTLGWNVLDAKVIAELRWRKQDNFQWLEIAAVPQFSWQNAMPIGLPPKAQTAGAGR